MTNFLQLKSSVHFVNLTAHSAVPDLLSASKFPPTSSSRVPLRALNPGHSSRKHSGAIKTMAAHYLFVSLFCFNEILTCSYRTEPSTGGYEKQPFKQTKGQGKVDGRHMLLAFFSSL